MSGSQDSAATQSSMYFICIAMLLDSLSLGLIIPVLPMLLDELSIGGIPEAATYGGLLLFAYAAMQFVSAPILGSLSDRFGRRPVLVVSLFAFAIDYLIMGFAPTLVWLFVGRILAGIAGATTTVANAYVADISAPEERARNFGVLSAAWGIGMILGPVVGGLLGDIGPRAPFFAAAGFAAANGLFGLFALRESLPQEHRRAFSLARANPVGAIRRVGRNAQLWGFLVICFAVAVGFDANISMWSYFTVEKFGWESIEVGLSLAYTGVLLALVQGILIRHVVDWLGEERALYLSFVFCVAGYFLIAYAPSGSWVYLFLVISALGTMVVPLLRGLMSQRVSESEQGELQGAITSVLSVSAIVSPLLMTQTFRFFTHDGTAFYFPGAPYALAGLLMVLCLASMPRVFRHGRELQAGPDTN